MTRQLRARAVIISTVAALAFSVSSFGVRAQDPPPAPVDPPAPVEPPPVEAPPPVETPPAETPAPVAAPEKPAPPAPVAEPEEKPAHAAEPGIPDSDPPSGEEDDVTREQSVDAFSDLEDAQGGPRGSIELRLRFTFGYVPAEGNTPADEIEVAWTPDWFPYTEFLAAQYFEHDDVDNTSGFLFGWNQRWVKDGGRASWVPSVGTLTEYFLRTPFVSGLDQFAPGATAGDHVGVTLTVAKYLGRGTVYLNGVAERRLFNTQICVNDQDVAYQPSDPRADQSPKPPQQDGCDYWADWAFAARAGYKLTVIPDVLDVVAAYWIETNEFATQKKSKTYPAPEDHQPYNIGELAVIWHVFEHLTVSPGIQVGLDGRDETPLYEAGLFFLVE